METLASRCCELLSVAGVVRVSSCRCLWRPAARPPPQTCLVWSDVVPPVVAPAEALDSRGCRLLLPAIVHVELYTCLCALPRTSQFAAGVSGLERRGSCGGGSGGGGGIGLSRILIVSGSGARGPTRVLTYGALSHIICRRCFWSGPARLWWRRFRRGKWPWWLLCAYWCNSVASFLKLVARARPWLACCLATLL